MQVTQKQKSELKNGLRDYYSQPCPPRQIIKAFFPQENEVSDEHRNLYVLLKLLADLLPRSYWTDRNWAQMGSNPCTKVKLYLDHYGVDDRIAYQLLVLENDWDKGRYAR